MRVYVTNDSTALSDKEVLDALPALRRQTYHVREYWRSSIEDLIFGEPPVDEAWQIKIVDDADQQGALGYHDFTPGGRPIAYVFAKTSEDNGISWTSVFSHEACEMILDPWISNGFQVSATQWYATELCDPVEAQSYTITAKNGIHVEVSNFVLPNWFVPGAPANYDWLGSCTKPLEVLDGGYAYYWDAKGGWQSIDHLDKTMSAEEFAKAHPDKKRLSLYARER